MSQVLQSVHDTMSAREFSVLDCESTHRVILLESLSERLKCHAAADEAIEADTLGRSEATCRRSSGWSRGSGGSSGGDCFVMSIMARCRFEEEAVRESGTASAVRIV